MKIPDVQKLNHGVYRIHWTEEAGGGTSLAVVGSMYSGTRWFACANWTGEYGRGIPGSDNKESWDLVEKAELIESTKEDELWQVVGDHPVLARPDKICSSQVEAYTYAASLKTLGYENVEITPPPPKRSQ